MAVVRLLLFVLAILAGLFAAILGLILTVLGAAGAAHVALEVVGAAVVVIVGTAVWQALSERRTSGASRAHSRPARSGGPAARPAAAVVAPAASPTGREGCAPLRTPHGQVVGVWFSNEGQARDRDLAKAVLARLGVLDRVGRGWTVQRNTSDDRGGAFVMFESSGGLTPGGASGEAATRPLPEPYEGLAARLAALVPDRVAGYGALDADQRRRTFDDGYLDQLIRSGKQPDGWLRDAVEIRAIGHRLNDEGGLRLMRSVIERAEALSPWRILREIESSWGGIGDWRA